VVINGRNRALLEQTAQEIAKPPASTSRP